MEYAILPSRIKAVVIDAIILIASMYLISELFASFETVPEYVRMAVFVLVVLLYDPIFTSMFGGTIGHSRSGITVRSESNHSKYISFPLAILRFVLKTFLGWLSLLTVTSSENRQAIHDLAAKSVVLTENEEA